MLRFECPNCQNELFFNSVNCVACGWVVSYEPQQAQFVAQDESRDCQNRGQHQICNWVMDGQGPFCLGCLANEFIPDLTVPGNRDKWLHLEDSKKRLYYSCLRLGIDTRGLVFRFLASTFDEPAVTGHCDGVITLNINEADPVKREKTRLDLKEKFRTLIGHFRHEFGHFYWQQRVAHDFETLERFRETFGDERQDYQACLDQHYATDASKGQEFISVYASSHPWEDWAETFAHYLHLRDVLETAEQFGFSQLKQFDFESGVAEWTRLSVAFNEINRSMGLPDLYPFALTDPVIDKLRFIHELVDGWSSETQGYCFVSP